jgi:hypothetical protein
LRLPDHVALAFCLTARLRGLYENNGTTES